MLYKDKEFEIMYNSLSLGWHLRRIIELEPNIMNDDILKHRFIFWLERHKIISPNKTGEKRNAKRRDTIQTRKSRRAGKT